MGVRRHCPVRLARPLSWGAASSTVDHGWRCNFDGLGRRDSIGLWTVDYFLTQRNRYRFLGGYPVELKQKADAIHLATAAYTNVDALHTYDGSGKSERSKLLSLDNKVPKRDGKLLRISMPDQDADGPLFGGTKDLRSEDKPEG